MFTQAIQYLALRATLKYAHVSDFILTGLLGISAYSGSSNAHTSFKCLNSGRVIIYS